MNLPSKPLNLALLDPTSSRGQGWVKHWQLCSQSQMCNTPSCIFMHSYYAPHASSNACFSCCKLFCIELNMNTVSCPLAPEKSQGDETQITTLFQAEHITFSTSNGSFVESINNYPIRKELNPGGHKAGHSNVFDPTSNGLPPNSLRRAHTAFLRHSAFIDSVRYIALPATVKMVSRILVTRRLHCEI